ncbi:CPBP family intramembrane glutamic endopeptidase [Nocardiopsis ansamitocini]|uniref:CAAX prenyl protease 2/Lysostaphin resistance protein A-like domain-containing protein n=1 Tax=Nocardiopsis ansamitocini TaxID=1670832 RepID=A0A9W6PAJ2_9ACTN|nr:CPBP family intramembrane glutamic endopeptidase [Nocardiopsis ansamitocini]GLU50008.1 hypothetical protein Nans01_43590 [Nocardiopsis ansamitocini]
MSVGPSVPAPPLGPTDSGQQTRVEYHQALRAAPGAWRGVLALLVFLAVAFLLLVLAVLPVANLIDAATGASAPQDPADGTLTMTPGLMLANNLMLASLVPVSMLVQWAVFGVRPRWMSSVEGGFRWRWSGRLALVVVPVWIVYVGLVQLLQPVDGIRLDGTAVAMVTIVLLTSPLQSAGEEYGFRGLVQRSTGSWLRDPTAAFVLSTAFTALPFALIHLSGDPWSIAAYLAAGIAMSLMVRFSGGLEASVLVHAVNNVLVLLPVMLAGEADSILDRGNGTGGPIMLLAVAMMLAVPFLVRWMARRHGVTVTAPLPPVRTGNARSR